jgi:GxxExxY protein
MSLLKIKFEREKEFNIKYKDIFLKHKFYADFIVLDDIILEIKVAQEITKEHIAQTINYVNLAKSRLGIIVNFKNRSIEHRRIAV